MTNHVRWFQDLTSKDTHEVGAKNASLGEMIASLQEDNIHVPAGFATTVEAYREFVSDNELEQTIRDGIDAWESGEKTLATAGKEIRNRFRHGRIPRELDESVQAVYRKLGDRYGESQVEAKGKTRI